MNCNSIPKLEEQLVGKLFTWNMNDIQKNLIELNHDLSKLV